MKKAALILLLSIYFSCGKKSTVVQADESIPVGGPRFTTVVIDNILSEKLSIRALLIDGNKVWYAANNGRVGNVNLSNDKQFLGYISRGLKKPEFRSIAQTRDNIFALSVADPGLLYRISKDGKEVQLMYEEKGEKVFYDAINFWNDNEGIAVGDPTEDCFSMLITRDGGTTWTKTPCDILPKVAEGEAFFAASNTNIIIRENRTWVVTGGKKSRVFHSDDKGISWKITNTPIIQGSAMTGIFSADFYDGNIGFATGGDYEKPTQNFGNKILSEDGGKTWRLIAEKTGFGYGSCVQFIPGSNGKELVVVGASGIYYSHDRGNTWSKLSNDSDLFTLRFLDSQTAIAAGKNKIVRLKFQ